MYKRESAEEGFSRKWPAVLANQIERMAQAAVVGKGLPRCLLAVDRHPESVLVIRVGNVVGDVSYGQSIVRHRGELVDLSHALGQRECGIGKAEPSLMSIGGVDDRVAWVNVEGDRRRFGPFRRPGQLRIERIREISSRDQALEIGVVIAAA